MLYYLDYELETASGMKVIHRYIGDKHQIIQAIQTARANNYRIIKCDHYTP